MKPGDVVDRYVIDGLLGAGAVGIVYRARHQALGTLHALKVVTPTSPAQRQRVVREARIQALLRHPNLVRVTDVLELDHQLVLVAELVEGPTLAEWLAGGVPDRPRAIDLFRQVLAGIEAAHAQGIIHRDLKPDNVLLTSDPERPVARVSDFGIARAADPDFDAVLMTRTGAAMGTPAYMAPEQRIDASTVDQRADIFSLGCILYELCVGQRPFTATTLSRLAEDVELERYPRPSEARPGISPALEGIIVDCLRPDPADRPASCAALRERLDGLGAPVGSLPPVVRSVTPRPGRAQTTMAPLESDAVELGGGRRGVFAGGAVLAVLAGLALGAARLADGEQPDAPAAVVEEPSADRGEAGAGATPGEALAGTQAEPEAATAARTGEDPANQGAVPTGAAQAGTAEGGTAQAGTAQAGAAQEGAAQAGDRREARSQASAPATGAAVDEAAPGAAAGRTVEPAASGAVSGAASGAASGRTAEPASTGYGGTRWRIVGEGVQARLVGEGGEFAPGPVPPGVFLVRARFGDQPELDAGYVSVRDGEETRVACDPSFQQCRRLP